MTAPIGTNGVHILEWWTTGRVGPFTGEIYHVGFVVEGWTTPWKWSEKPGLTLDGGGYTYVLTRVGLGYWLINPAHEARDLPRTWWLTSKRVDGEGVATDEEVVR